MAHPLGAIFDIPHGVANALLLPVIMEFNAPAALSKYVDIAIYLVHQIDSNLLERWTRFNCLYSASSLPAVSTVVVA